MATTITTQSSSASTGFGTGTPLSASQQTFWSTRVLMAVQPVLLFQQAAVVQEEFRTNAGLTLSFLRYNDLSDTGGHALTELVDVDGQHISNSSFSMSIGEVGAVVTHSELALVASFDDVMTRTTQLLSRRYARETNRAARNACYGTPNVIYPNNRAGRASLTVGDTLSAEFFDELQARLTEEKVPMYNDGASEFYLMFISPRQHMNLKRDPEFRDIAKYASPQTLWNGEVGRYNRFKFIETTMLHTIKKTDGSIYEDSVDTGTDAGTYSTDVDVHRAIVLGAYGLAYGAKGPLELRVTRHEDRLGRLINFGYYGVEGYGRVEEDHIYTIETSVV